jgi:hypothetical protein
MAWERRVTSKRAPNHLHPALSVTCFVFPHQVFDIQIGKTVTSRFASCGALFVLIACCLVLSSCGGSADGSSAAPGVITNGNWSIVATSTVTPGGTFTIGGSLVQSGTSVTGLLTIERARAVSSVPGSSCFPLNPIPFAGTLNSDSLTLKSSSLEGQIITIEAVGSGSLLAGTYSIAGGCEDGDSGTVAANYIPSLTGTWTGNVSTPDGVPLTNPIDGRLVTAYLTLTQSATAVDGYFPLSGTFSMGGGLSCFTSGTIPDSQDPIRAFVAGDRVVISAQDASGGGILYAGQLTNSANMIMGNYLPRPTPGGCGVVLLGNFFRQ